MTGHDDLHEEATETDGIVARIVRVSGNSASDCCFIAQRFEDARGDFRPEHGECFVCTVTPRRTRLEIGGQRWLTGIWRAPEGSIYVSELSGRLHVLPARNTRWTVLGLEGALSGVWGLDERNVWVWGFREHERERQPTLHYFDGNCWSSVTPPGSIVAMHGTTLEHVIAVGHRGLIARYDGASFRCLESPVRETLSSVSVASASEAYAIGPSGVLLRGSAEGWWILERLEHPLQAVAAHRGALYAGAPWPAGLMKRKRAGLASVDREKQVFQMESREELLLATPGAVLSSPDGEAWKSLPIANFERLVADKVPGWRTP
jgi:hypothetical protein